MVSWSVLVGSRHFFNVEFLSPADHRPALTGCFVHHGTNLCRSHNLHLFTKEHEAPKIDHFKKGNDYLINLFFKIITMDFTVD
jgi:hypothetical protein